jgi:regulator of CtrA degradation
MSSFRIPHHRSSATLLSFHDRFTASPQFAKLYREGMGLVEETAEYLDGEGRSESRRLEPPASLAYTSESIRLTTRLTQLASWLLVRRAIAAGEITAAQAHTHRHKVTLSPQSGSRPDGFNSLPETFKRLILDSHRLYDRVLRLERLMNDNTGSVEESHSPVVHHMEKIRLAFPAA